MFVTRRFEGGVVTTRNFEREVIWWSCSHLTLIWGWVGGTPLPNARIFFESVLCISHSATDISTRLPRDFSEFFKWLVFLCPLSHKCIPLWWCSHLVSRTCTSLVPPLEWRRWRFGRIWFRAFPLGLRACWRIGSWSGSWTTCRHKVKSQVEEDVKGVWLSSINFR